MNSWILLERPAAQLKTLYSMARHPHTQMLFAGTSLNKFTAQSPLLVRLNNQPTLNQAIEQNPEEWPGLLIESTCDTPSVLAHLRQILFVNFDQQRKGVLRYSNPTVASYFFGASAAQEHSLWLGPISRLRWFGATWGARAKGMVGWNQLDNPHATNWNIERTGWTMALSAAQEDALIHHRNEAFLYEWWEQNPQHAFALASDLMNQAIGRGIETIDEVCTFLDEYFAQAQP